MSASTDGRRWPSAGPAGRPRARPAARRAQRLRSAAHVGRPPTPRWLDSPLPSPFSADPMVRVHRPQNAAAIDAEVPARSSPSGACSWRMVVCDRAFITGAMGGAMGGAILPRVYKRQRSNFACPDCRNLVPMAVVVKAAGHLYPAVPMPPAAPPDGRACRAASRRLPAAAATRGGLAAAWRVVVSSLTLHQFRQDRVSSHPPDRPLLGFLRRTRPPGAADWPSHPLLPAPPPLAVPAALDPTHRLSAPCRL